MDENYYQYLLLLIIPLKYLLLSENFTEKFRISMPNESVAHSVIYYDEYFYGSEIDEFKYSIIGMWISIKGT